MNSSEIFFKIKNKVIHYLSKYQNITSIFKISGNELVTQLASLNFTDFH
ncbi:hypothetical protein MSHRCOH1_04030 [Candidatus Ornithobacterium hominis]|nr:hypothetical protein MSHRCOH1_04030 [Candidatus Ornithobacterium hominis]